MADDNKDLNIFLRLKDEFSAGIKSANDTLVSLEKQTESVSKSTEKLQAAFNGMALKGGLAFGALSLAIGGFISEAKESEAVTNKLRQALLNQGLEVESNIKQIDKLANSIMRKSTFDDEEIKGITTKLVTYGLHDQALAKMTQGMVDYAAFSGKDMQGASMRVGLAIEGATDKVKGLDINLKGVVGTQQRAAIVTEALARKFEGQAEAATLGLGALDVLKNTSKELGEDLGMKLAPTIIGLTKALQGFVDFVSAHPVFTNIVASTLLLGLALSGIVTLIGTVGGGFISFITTLGTVIKVMQSLNIVAAITNALLAVNPITWIVLACVAAVAAIALLVVNWNKVVAAFKTGAEWIKNNFVNIATFIFKAFTNPIGLIKEHWTDLMSWMGNLWGNIKNMAKEAWDWITRKKGEKVPSSPGATSTGGSSTSTSSSSTTTMLMTSGFSTEGLQTYKQALETTADESLAIFQKIGQGFTDNVVNGLVQGTLDMSDVWAQFTMDLETQILENAFNPITEGMTTLATSLTGVWNQTFGLLLSPITSLLGSMISGFATTFLNIGNMAKVFQLAWTGITFALGFVWQMMTTGMVLDWIKALSTTLMGFLTVAGSMIMGLALIAAAGAAAAVALIPFIGPVLAPIAYWATFALVIAGVAQLAGAAVGLAYGTSEVIGGNSGDTVPAMLTPGEMVVPKSMAEGIRSGDVSLGGGANEAQASNTTIVNVYLDGAQFIGEFTTEIIRTIANQIGEGISNRMIAPFPTGA